LVDIPVVCGTCATLFFAPNLVGGTAQVEFKNSSLGPCPVCGGVGDIIDGVYSAATNTAKLIISSATKPQQLKAIEAIFLAAKKHKLSSVQINERVHKEVPELQTISDWIPKTRMELYTFIGIVLALITYISTTSFNFIDSNNNTSEKMVKELVDKAVQDQVKAQKPLQKPKKNKIGRNEPCPCGSGKKYKKCCLIRI
jgi:hypothetical protein